MQNISNTTTTKKLSPTALIHRLMAENAELKVRLAEAEEKAAMDCFTGLYNRASFDKRLAEEMARADRLGAPLSLVFIDLDDLKRLNTQHGHYRANQLLQMLGELLRNSTRKADIGFRFGGDEFCLILPDTTAEQAYEVVSRLLSLFRATNDLGATLSIGYTEWQSSDNYQRIIERANAAMFEAKAAGKNCIKFAQGGK
jgi:two-component system cell cycle response regulator